MSPFLSQERHRKYSDADEKEDFSIDDRRSEITGKIADKAGEVLPATGGPGRNIIYKTGGLLAAAGLVFLALMNKKRAS